MKSFYDKNDNDKSNNPYSTENTRKIFHKAQNKISLIFNDKKSEIKINRTSSFKQLPTFTNLKNNIQEFYKVQREFHESMAKFTLALSQDISLSDTKKINCQELLKPLNVLANNPFNDNPTGNDDEDIKHILDVITTQNQNFQMALRALALSISKSEVTQEILIEIKENPESVNLIKETMGCNSWMLIEGQVGKPMQNLTRIELLLKEIQKGLNNNTESLGEWVQKLQNALADLSKQIQSINDNMDDLILLNQIERVLQALSEQKGINTNYSIYINKDENEEHYAGCNLFLMTKPKIEGFDNYMKSNKNNLYLYQENDEKIFYYILENEKKYFLKHDGEYLKFPKNAVFKSTNKNLIKYVDENVKSEVLSITSRRGHTPLMIKLKDYITSTLEVTRQGLRNVLLDSQDFYLLYKELLNFLQEISKGCEKINLKNNSSGFFSYFSSYLYSQEEKNNPVTELNKLIVQLKILVDRLEIINNIPMIQEKARLDFIK